MIGLDGDLDDLKRLLNPTFLRKAELSALKATRGKVATVVSKRVRERYNVTAATVSSKLKVGLRNDNTEAWLSWIGRRIGLINFGAQFKRVKTLRGRRIGATVKVRKDTKRFLVKGGFIAEGSQGNVHIFERMGSTRLKIRSRTGPSVPQMVSSQKVVSAAEHLVETEYPTILKSKLDFFLEKQFR